jgi:hypothetical protein
MSDDPPLSKEATLHAQADTANIRPGRSVESAVIAHAQADMARLAPTPAESPSSTAPSTASVLWAAWRQGLKDLQTAVLGDWGGHQAEAGSIANPLPMEIYHDRHHEAPPPETLSYESGLAASAARTRDRESPGHTR